MKTTLKKIKEQYPCNYGWKKLLTFLNKTDVDDEELSLLTIFESNGLNDALWALKCVEGQDKEIRLMACDFAESVVHLANDERCVNAIKVSRDYGNGLASKGELTAASAAASAAAMAAMDAAMAASAAAMAAASAAAMAAMDAAMAAMDAEQEKQIEIFKKYVKK
jgi:hypothetical protein